MSERRLTVRELPVTERPYEKFEHYGPQTLSDAELLAIILRSGTQDMPSTDLARQVLSLGEHLGEIHRISMEELMTIKGIGRVKAIQIKAIAELSTRISKQQRRDRVRIQSPRSVAECYMEEMRYLEKEHLKCVFLNAKNEILSDPYLTVGTVNASLVEPRDIYIEALKKKAVHLIILHNHPSGDPTPSQEDIQVTKKLVVAGNYIGVSLIDHIIIGDGCYISLKEQGYI